MVGELEVSIDACCVRSIINDGCVFENVVMMGADNYEDFSHELRAGVGSQSKIQNAIIDKNARIGRNVSLSPGRRK